MKGDGMGIADEMANAVVDAYIAGYRGAMSDSVTFIKLCANTLEAKGLTATPSDVYALAKFLESALTANIERLESGE